MVQANATYYNAAYRHFADRLRGGPLGEEPRSFGPLVARLSRITEPYVAHYLKSMLKGRGPMRVLDVGCGDGAHLRGLLEASPESAGIGLEMDAEVVRRAEENLAAWGLQERARVVHGEAGRLPTEVGGDFDLVLALSMIYYVEVPERAALLGALRSRLAEGGALVLATSCRGEGVDLFSANLNVATSSMVGLTPLPTVEEMEAQLREAGFTRLRRTRLVPGATYFGITAS
jgi:SAM-dependent methyltransferase